MISEDEIVNVKKMEPDRLKMLGFTNSEGNLSLHDSDSDNDIKYEVFSSEEEDPQADMKGIPLSLYDNKRKGFGPKGTEIDAGIKKYFDAVIHPKKAPQTKE